MTILLAPFIISNASTDRFSPSPIFQGYGGAIAYMLWKAEGFVKVGTHYTRTNTVIDTRKQYVGIQMIPVLGLSWSGKF